MQCLKTESITQQKTMKRSNGLSNFTKELIQDVNWWFNAAAYQDGQRYIVRIKLVQIVAFVTFFITSLLNYFSLLPYSYIVTAATTAGLMWTRFLINKGKLATAKVYMLILTSLSLLVLSYIEGNATGNYLYYFVMLIICIFLYEENSFRDIKLSYAFILLCLGIAFLFFPEKNSLQKISKEQIQLLFYENMALTFLLAVLISYVMIKDSSLRERSLRMKQGFLDSVYNTSLDAVFIIDTNSMMITDCNYQSLQLFEAAERNELIGHQANELFKELQDEDENNLLLKVVNENDSNWQGEMSCITVQKNEFTGYVSIVPFIYEGVKLKKLNILDITDIKQAEAALKLAKEKAEHLAEIKSKFLSNMSHELRTPLNGIIGTTNLLLQETYLPTQKQHYDILKFSSEHMLNLINDILDFSKIEAGKMELEKNPFNLSRTLSTLYRVFQHQFEAKNVTFTLEADENFDKEFIGDELRLNQVFSNLLSNALKFTPSGGKVIFQAKHLFSNSNVATICFSVQDNGIGIPTDKQEKIFDSFTQVDTATTRRSGGTGLGLAISKRIVELLGSKLKLVSFPGQGSQFYFNLEIPFNQVNNNFMNEKLVRGLQSLKGMKVLLAEDNPVNMMVAKKFLERWDIEITEAVNGVIALDKFKQGQYDMLLIDLEMPEMDGYEVVSAVKKINSEIPTIAFTAAVYDNMHSHLVASGFSDYIQKPFRPEDLHKKLSKYYEKVRA